MSLSDQTLSALQTLMAQDKELQARVQAVDDATQAATLIADAATRQGIAVDAADLQTYFAQIIKDTAGQALSDAQLEAVAGGLDDTGKMVLMSIFSLGTGCIIVSIFQATNTPALGLSKKFCVAL